MKRSKGFTIVELLIVIVVIAILAAISIVAYNGVQQRARNSDRSADINAIQKAVEIYYAERSVYPNQYQMAETTGNENFTSTTLKLPRSSVLNPQVPTGVTHSVTTDGAVFNGAPTQYYLYRASQADGTPNCWSTSQTCTGYWIRYRVEGSSANIDIYGGNFPR